MSEEPEEVNEDEDDQNDELDEEENLETRGTSASGLSESLSGLNNGDIEVDGKKMNTKVSESIFCTNLVCNSVLLLCSFNNDTVIF